MTPPVPNNNPWLYVAGLLVTFLTGIGLKDIILGLFKRKPRATVEVTNQIDLARQAAAYAQQLEEDASQARASAQKAWATVDEAQQKLERSYRRLDDATWKLEQAGRYLDAVMAKIFQQGVTIEDVREYVRGLPPPPATSRNGRRPEI